MEQETLAAIRRNEHGTRVTRKLRASGRLPAVIYGHGEKPEHISLSQHDIEVALAHGARTLAVDMEGATTQYLIKVVQYDHLGAYPIHLDLTRFDLDERVKVKVGIELRGVPKGLTEGGVLDQILAEIEVECRVTDIPETLRPFVTGLDVGDSLLVKDIEWPPGVTPLADGDDRIAMVKALAIAAEEAEDGEEEEGGQQPELIGRAKKEDEEEEKKK